MNKKKLTEQNFAAADELPGLLGAKVFPVLFLISLLALLGMSLAMVYSATVGNRGETFFYLQIRWILIGTAIAILISFLPLPKLMKYAHWGLLIIGLPLGYLALASILCKFSPDLLNYFPFVPHVKGALRWLRIPLLGQVQPSELAKLVLIFYLSAYYGSKSRKDIKKFIPGVLIPGLPCGIILVLILLGRDLSTTVITGATLFLIMFVAGVRLRLLLPIALLGILLGSLAIASSPERQSRITAYKAPELHQNDDSYQLWRSVLSLGNGGLSGRGFAHGIVKTYLPEAHTDFIIAVIGEELGFIGIVLVLLLYFILCISMVCIGQQCRLRSDMLLCMAVAGLISMQALVNIGVATAWLPTTGVTAPFISYGGTSMLVLLMMAGLILNTARRNLNDIWEENMNSSLVLTYRSPQLKHDSKEE